MTSSITVGLLSLAVVALAIVSMAECAHERRRRDRAALVRTKQWGSWFASSKRFGRYAAHLEMEWAAARCERRAPGRAWNWFAIARKRRILIDWDRLNRSAWPSA
jgi:hypothetical protein